MPADPDVEQVQRSSRDPEVLRSALERWLATVLPAGADPVISALSSPSATGMSSETLLFDARWTTEGGVEEAAFVARVEPDLADEPIFPVYDLDVQFRLLRLVREHGIPVPAARWHEPDPAHLGAPFFVMERVDGRVPPDIPPYTMDGWLLTASPAERAELERSTIDVLARLHAIDVTRVDVDFLRIHGDRSPLRAHFERQRDYYEWARRGRTHPVLEATFDWLEAHWPADEGETVISWGDARIGNVIYDGFTPAAVLDWEMAALGPRGLDVGWLIFLHVFFQEITEQLEMPGLPDLLTRERVAAEYAARTGVEVPDLRFYEVYAALRHGIVMTRVHERRVHFGEAEWPDDVDAVIYHRPALERMLAGDATG